MEAHSDRTSPHTDLEVDASVAAVVIPVCHRLGLRHQLKGEHLFAVMFDMVSLDANGANEAELTAYGLALLDLARTLKSQHTTDDKTLERMRFDADIADSHLDGILKIEGESATGLDALAALKEKAAALNVASARRDRQKARQIRSGRAVSHKQLGLSGGAA